MTSGLSVRIWNDAAIARRDEDGYANATAMCQANGKEWSNYKQLEHTQVYIQALSSSLGIPTADLVITTTTGPNEFRGTWIHPRLAVDLARWISPQFAVWMDGWFLDQLNPSIKEQAPAGPWSKEHHDYFYRQPIPWQIAQLLVQAVETNNTDLARKFGQWFADGGKKKTNNTPRRFTNYAKYTSVHNLPPSARDTLLAIDHLTADDSQPRTIDVCRAIGCDWTNGSIRGRLSEMHSQGVIAKHRRCWQLTPFGQRLLASAA